VGAITSSLTDHGGELIFRTRVTKIHATSSGVRGVSLANGQEINAPVVISNINAMTTFQNLLEPGQLPSGYLQKINRLEQSVSVLGLYLATNLDVNALGVPKVTIITPWDLESIYKDALTGKVSGLAVHIPTVCDPSLAPDGEHLVILQAIIPSQGFDLSLQDQFAEELLDGAERVLPDLRNHITFADGSATDNPRQYRLRRLGPMYGWAASPQQSGPRRLSPRTPIAGLFLTGHWTQPGHGIWTVVLSGINTARLVLGEDGSRSLWPFAL
jgi:prolycopene isomerase